MSGRARITRHGANHNPGGSDPITGLDVGIEFDTDNQGGWLDVQTNDTDGDGLGIHVNDDSGGGILIEAEGGAIGIDLESDGSRIEINDASAGITIIGGNSPGGPVVIDTAPANVTIKADVFRVVDGSNNPIFEVRSDGSVHILTSTSVVADL